MGKVISLKKRLMAKIEKVGGKDGCWIWNGSVGGAGYGEIRIGGKGSHSGPKTSPHRVSYTLFNGAIPDDKEIDHKCNVKTCCNPRHLQLVTHKENCELREKRRYEALSISPLESTSH